MLDLGVRSKVKPGSVVVDAIRIGKLAERSGVAATARRYYEKAGLLPSPQRTSSGYRVYDASVLPRLAFIRAAQTLSLSLAEIRDVISIRETGAAPYRHLVDLVERDRAARSGGAGAAASADSRAGASGARAGPARGSRRAARSSRM
jgi:DNA-binding transcriptional MerR regulator